ncbi:gag polymerase env [Lasallia pustulata]|uniref:Gag polymerase env n=1 Tax=Lasallia pustulata TaxID=136370 RepID=A0A1W5D4D4_9LECA|nr:gag polymerase env [Lasallia pustulata]
MRVETDASAFAIGRILTQKFKIDSHLHWLPVAYYSKKLLDTETRYGTGEQKLLAIMEAMHHWRHYCQGARHPIVVLTNYANLVWFMTTPNLTRRQLKWVEKLAEYDFNVTYREGKKNPANGLSRRPDYKLPEASTTSTAAETEKLYMLAAMTLRPRCPVQQLRQEDVVPDTNADVGMEDGSAATTEESSVRHLPAREAGRDNDAVVRQDNIVPNINMDGGTTGTPAVCDLSAREASRDGDAVVRQDNVVPNINMDGSTAGTPAVHNLYAREASRDGYAVVQRDNVVPNIIMDGSTTETPAVRNLYAQEASRDGDAVVQ